MRTYFPALFIALSLLSVSQAHAQLDDHTLGLLTELERGEFGRWRAAASECGRQYRIRVHYGYTNWVSAYADIKDMILNGAAERGATIAQLKKISKSFDQSQRWAIDDGYTNESEVEPVDEQQLRDAKQDAANLIAFCLDVEKSRP